MCVCVIESVRWQEGRAGRACMCVGRKRPWSMSSYSSSLDSWSENRWIGRKMEEGDREQGLGDEAVIPIVSTALLVQEDGPFVDEDVEGREV